MNSEGKKKKGSQTMEVINNDTSPSPLLTESHFQLFISMNDYLKKKNKKLFLHPCCVVERLQEQRQLLDLTK